MLDCQVLTTETEIAAIADEWRLLFARAGRTPYGNYDWVNIWWRTIGSARASQKLVVVIGRENGRLAAVVPLVVVRCRGLRILQAAGLKSYHYCETLCENTAQAIELWQAVRRKVRYHIADIRDVYPGTPSYEALSSFSRAGDKTNCYYLNVKWTSGEEWVNSLSRKVRSNFRRRQNQLEEKGAVSLDVYKDGPELPALIKTMVGQKTALCKLQGKRGLFDCPKAHEFFQELVADGIERKTMLLMVLRCGGDNVAYALNFTCNDVMQVYIITYNTEWSKYSPGNVLMTRLMSWAIENGYRGLNLMHENDDFKRQYVNEVLECREFIFSGSPVGHLMENAYCALRALLRKLKGTKLPLSKSENQPQTVNA